MRRNTFDVEKIRYWFVVDRIPFTKILIVSNILSFILIALFFRQGQIENILAFEPAELIFRPWTVLTYAFISQPNNPIFMLFALYWLWVAGGSLERSWGTTRYAWFFLSMTAISALGLFTGGLIAGKMIGLIGLWLPLAGLTVAFAMTNPEQQILFFFVLPLKLKYLALLDVILVLVNYGQIDLRLGVLALLGCAYSYWYIQPNRFSFNLPKRSSRSNVTRVYEKRSIFSSLNPLRKMKEARDRERLRKLFERSFDDEDDPGRR